MRKIVVFGFGACLCLLLASCMHSMGDSRMTRTENTATAIPGKRIAVAVILPSGVEASDTPAFIANQLCMHLKSVSISAVPESASNLDEALSAAKAAESDYLLYATVNAWKKSSLLSPTNHALLHMQLYDAHQGRIVADSIVEATCYAMLAGLEASPRECARPQLEQWVKEVFGREAPTAPHSVPIRMR